MRQGDECCQFCLTSCCWKVLKSLGQFRCSSTKSCLRGSYILGGSSKELRLDLLSKLRESLDLLRDRFRELLLGELEKRDFFWRKPRRLLSLPLMGMSVDVILLYFLFNNKIIEVKVRVKVSFIRRKIFQLYDHGWGVIILSVIITMTTEQNAEVEKVEKILLQLNKTGLSYLKYLQYKEAIDFFKKAQRIVQEELMISTKNQRISQLAGVTFNNLACYYKKTKRPKVALVYLKRSLQLQVYKINDWVSTGSTHLNICAIYSYLGKHEQAINHVNLALQLLDKKQFGRDDASEEGKSYWNIKMLCFYNKAIEEEHLRLYQQSLSSYQLAKEIAKSHGSKNVGIVLNCDEAIARIQTLLANLRKKMVSIIMRRKEEEQTGHYDFMRNHKPLRLKSNSREALEKVKRFSLYKSSSTKNKERKVFFSKPKQPDQKQKQNQQQIQRVQRKSTSSRFKSLNEYLNQKNKTQPAQGRS